MKEFDVTHISVTYCLGVA